MHQFQDIGRIFTKTRAQGQRVGHKDKSNAYFLLLLFWKALKQFCKLRPVFICSRNKYMILFWAALYIVCKLYTNHNVS